jgi:hypothetical protein
MRFGLKGCSSLGRPLRGKGSTGLGFGSSKARPGILRRQDRKLLTECQVLQNEVAATLNAAIQVGKRTLNMPGIGGS